MPAPKLRSTSFRGRSRRTPSGRASVIGKPKKPSAARCALCGRRLAGVPKRGAGELRRYAKTEKRPERAFAGVLCGNCTARIVREKARLGLGELDDHAVDLTHLTYIKQLR